jgi:hypothetical protein
VRYLLAALLFTACTQKPAEWAAVSIASGGKIHVQALTALAPDDLWGVSRPSVFHYDGKQWALTGDPGCEHISAAAHDDVWGVGRGGSWFHFDGKTWSSGRVEEPAKKYLDFYGVAAWPGEVWATAGDEGYYRFDGKDWSHVFPPELAGWKLQRMSAIGRHVFVGLSKDHGEPAGRRTFESQLGHFDGKSWSLIDQPSGLQVRGSGPDDLWIVRKTPMHFDGRSWLVTTLPDNAAVPYDLFARSKTEAYLVGAKGLAMKWDGTAWKEIHSGTQADLLSVTGGATGPIWAGGAPGQMLLYAK